MVIIPNFDIDAYTESIVLDNVPYEFGFTWNTRDNSWSMSIKQAGISLLESVKVVNSFFLTDLYVNTLLPNGLILSIDLQDIKRNPNRNELGSAVKIAYITENEVNSGTF